MYDTIQDLPFVCRVNLPEPAQQLYRDAFNRAWAGTADEKARYRAAMVAALDEVRAHFARDEAGRWRMKT
jgi:cation transport regulator ChaB